MSLTPYKGISYDYDLDVEPEECTKIFHYAVFPDGTRHHIDMSPYTRMRQTDFENWVDAGFPSRTGPGPLDGEDLQKLADAKR
jgi:hypothetical protein